MNFHDYWLDYKKAERKQRFLKDKQERGILRFFHDIVKKRGDHMRKKISIALGVALVAGVLSLLAKKDKPISFADHSGKWWFINRQKGIQHSLEVRADGTVLIDQRPLRYQLIELTPQRLVLQDSYGYHLILTKQPEHYTFYDEADDHTFELEAFPNELPDLTS